MCLSLLLPCGGRYHHEIIDNIEPAGAESKAASPHPQDPLPYVCPEPVLANPRVPFNKKK
eukprot:COSAG06_NODE_5968_length_3179_cov_62.289935_1_plen_59_part_10